ncbi:hypothetical protein PtA15_8A589 [Puccinia triticina]|uniref:Uncharacterized protein n=1 Tax=Puccinia triticina TaxID=208348 RepID=A0ABY7CQZ0_9BASI|nr:uncharacterized protein PtA15_8A589 [Puccinia triticina]WAQ87683.1 hypothetical protein PtA15_8A589 [Puccinia triticina]WAR57544.1 hypothetical protein PtB15_8B596 [Puccinia triticina]
MISYFIRQLYWILLLIDHAFVLTTSDPEGERIPMLIDLNAFPPDEPLTTSRLCSLQPIPSSDALKRDSVAQSYPHWLASASKTFPVNDHSTSPHKRKSVDAGIEKMALIDPAQKRQKTSLEYQKNWVVENEVSQPQTTEPVNLREKEKPVIEKSRTSPNDRDVDISRLEESERKRVPFNVKDWSFVRASSNMHSNEDNERFKNCFYVMKTWKRNIELVDLNLKPPQNVNEEFWLPKQYERVFVDRFKEISSSKLRYPGDKVLLHSHRNSQILNTILKLTDEKLDLEGYPVFSSYIVEYIAQKLKQNLNKARTKSWGRTGRLQPRIENIKKLTKCATFMHIVLLSLFNEHQNGILTKGYIEDFLIYLGHVWRDFESGSNNILKDDTGHKMYKLLNFQVNWETAGAGSILSTAWRIVRYCAKERGEFFPTEHAIVAEMVNKIIFHSNYETIINKAQETVQQRQATKILTKVRNLG